MNRIPDPLDANERALADLLARDASAGPSPQLDARILAAARAATATPARDTRRPRPRWIAGMAVAATLVLAVGIAWRLRPLPQRPVASEAPTMVSAVRVVEPSRQAESRATIEAAKSVPVPAMVRTAAPPPPLPADEAQPDMARRQPPLESPAVFDEPAPVETEAPQAFSAPAPQPAPAAPAASTPAPAGNVMRMELPEQARQKQAAGTLDRVEVTGSRTEGQDAAAAADAAAEEGVPRAVLDEEPPATADSPLVQEAWLQRIRELLSQGETDAARSSLAEFRRRYPNYPLPEDLRSLKAP